MEAKKTQRGRKPIEDKKKCIRLYILSSVVEANGGEENLKGYLEIRAERRARHMTNIAPKK